MRVSVVICTLNRADGLRQTLRCLERQRHADLEVVVVNGPSTDHTVATLDEFTGRIKVEHNPVANLSISRNLGIRAAAGDIVAFIDDDALPELCWLEQALAEFDSDDVGGVGGIVFDHTGMALQYRYSAANRFGEATWSQDEPYDALCVPGAATFPYLQGTNALFRRDVLARIGLFDETYDYYLDETDLCCRIVDAGYVLRQLPDAPVHHKYLPSAVRNQARVITNWFPVVKNHTYFGYRHALHEATELEVIDRARAFIDHLIDDTRMHEQLGNLPHGHTQRALEACGPALAEGIRIGRERHGLRLDPVVLERDDFLRYPTAGTAGGRRVVLVSSGYRPNVTGGIARFISDVAPELAALGTDVRVLTTTQDVPTVDLEDGVWVHRLAPAPTPGRLGDGPAHVDGFATAVADEVERIGAWWRPDVVYGSLWDVELLGVLRAGGPPIVPMLATPTAEVATHEGWDDPRSPNHLTIRRLVELERELVAGAAAVHAISDAIVVTFDRLYADALDPARTIVAHIGRADEVGDRIATPATPSTVLFVGRLEPRKGIDVFLSAADRVLQEHPDVRVVVAGDDSRPAPDGVPYPEHWRADHPDCDRLVFVGAVADDALSALIDDASIVVMPSRYESFGLVVVEAMMHRRPSVASAVGGIAELVEDGVTGRLVPVGDADALARAVGDLLDDPAEAAAIGARARAHYERYLTTRAAAQRLHALLDDVIARSRRGVEAVSA